MINVHPRKLTKALKACGTLARRVTRPGPEADLSRCTGLLVLFLLLIAYTGNNIYAAPSNLLTRYLEMKLNADGTFTSSTDQSNRIEIDEGDSVTFTGLEKTDGIVRISRPPIVVSNQGGGSTVNIDPSIDICTDLASNYETQNGYPAKNEFTGPMRKGVSGLFSLGPLAKPGNSRSLREVEYQPVIVPGNPVIANHCNIGEPIVDVQGLTPFKRYQLCGDNLHANESMDLTFENPDVDGITIRMNWKDIEIEQDRYDFRRLDLEMTKAVKNGKVFNLDFRSGIYGMPDHEYTSNGGAVTPLEFNTVLTTSIDNCNDLKSYTLPSPMQQSYKDAYETFLIAVIEHVRSKTTWWQALAYFKLSGVNLNTSEAKTAHLCDAKCGFNNHSCATKEWAMADIDVAWTPQKLYAYYREVGNTIFENTLRQKSIGYQLIQNGYPRAVYPDNYFVTDGYDDDTCDDKDLPRFDEQTQTVLDNAQAGLFTTRSGFVNASFDAGKAFVPQHSGLQVNPLDSYQGNNTPHLCAFSQALITDPNSPYYHMASFPYYFSNNLTDDEKKTLWGNLDGPISGCPNKWARREGYEQQLIGWQTNNANGVANPNEVSSALFNATTNSNGIFVELYEERIWEIMRTRGSGSTAAPVSNDPNATFHDYAKNLHSWSEEFHARRKIVADNDTSQNTYLRDPFPTKYTHRFTEDLAPGERVAYFFVSPYKCEHGALRSANRVGEIIVTGK